MSSKYGPNIVTNELFLYLDAANPKSYANANDNSIWKDLSGNNNHATLVRDRTTWPVYNSSNYGNFRIDLSSYVQLPNLSLNYPFHISFMGKDVSDGTAGGGIFIYFTSPSDNYNIIGLALIAAAGEIRNVYYPSSGYTSIVASTNYNTVYYVSGNYASTGYELYVNGRFINSSIGTKLKLWTDSSSSYAIGKLVRPVIFWGNGVIYSTQMYNRTLSAIEVQQNFNALKGRYGL